LKAAAKAVEQGHAKLSLSAWIWREGRRLGSDATPGGAGDTAGDGHG